MMSREMMWEMLMALGEDVTVWEESADESEFGFHVVVEDFAGFDEHWSEVDREFDDPEAVDRFCEMLESECLSREGDFYVVYHFDGFSVELGYASFEI